MAKRLVEPTRSCLAEQYTVVDSSGEIEKNHDCNEDGRGIETDPSYHSSTPILQPSPVVTQSELGGETDTLVAMDTQVDDGGETEMYTDTRIKRWLRWNRNGQL